jgi:hypothetical protein
MASGHEPRSQAEHMAAPTKPCDVKILLANSEPSTHGTFETSIDCPVYGRFREQCGHQLPANCRT